MQLERSSVLQPKFFQPLQSDLFCFAPPHVLFTPPVTNYMLLYSTLLCKNLHVQLRGRKRYKPTKLGEGGENRFLQSYTNKDLVSTLSLPKCLIFALAPQNDLSNKLRRLTASTTLYWRKTVISTNNFNKPIFRGTFFTDFFQRKVKNDMIIIWQV